MYDYDYEDYDPNGWKVLLICFIILVGYIFSLAYMKYQKETIKIAEEAEIPPEVTIVENEVYEEEILPDGLYLYSVDGAYLTAGIQTIGSMNGSRACQVTFYGTSEFGENISTYEDIIVQSTDDEYLFEGILAKSCYNIHFNEWGTIEVIQNTEEVDTPLSFKNTYIYLYSFTESTVEELSN